MASASLLTAKNISKEYAAVDDGERVSVLRDINFSINAGESAAIVGPSGCGKSTFLNIIGTLDTPTSGEVIFENETISRLNQDQLAAVRNAKIGFIFQAHHLLPQCTVLENVLIPLLAADKARRPEAEERGRKLLDRVGLGQRLSHRPGQLSGGERQRVAVVRALINRPKLLLADEPTGALDRKSSENLAHLLTELNREENVALIVVTHAQDLARKMQRVYELVDGRLVDAAK